MNDTLTAVDGFRVGHCTDEEALTGLTVVLPPEGAVASVSVRGAAPGTRELGPLRPGTTVDRVDAILLTGGSAFGLDAAAGVMQYLAGLQRGVRVGDNVVPIVPGAVVYDLDVGIPRVPSPDDAYLACTSADSAPVKEGSVGAGAGCTVGKLLGMGRSMRGGLGSAVISLPGGGMVAALAVVNAVGEITDERGRILAGIRDDEGFVSSEQVLIEDRVCSGNQGANTTLAVIATDVMLDKTGCRRLAEWTHDGLARGIRPCHTSMDGDVVFVISGGQVSCEMDRVGVAAVQAAAGAVRRGVRMGVQAAGIPAYRDIIAEHHCGTIEQEGSGGLK